MIFHDQKPRRCHNVTVIYSTSCTQTTWPKRLRDDTRTPEKGEQKPKTIATILRTQPIIATSVGRTSPIFTSLR